MKNTAQDGSHPLHAANPGQGSRLAWTMGHLRSLGPYVALELIMPGGTLMAALFWLYRHWRSSKDTPAVNPFARPISVLKIRWSGLVSSIQGRRSARPIYSSPRIGRCCNGG